jgi:hypothetical protein
MPNSLSIFFKNHEFQGQEYQDVQEMTKKPLTKKCTNKHCKLHHIPFTLGYNYGFYLHFLLSDHNNHELVK